MSESSDNRLIKDIPSDWEAIKLKRVVKIVTGNTPPKSQENNYAEEGVPWVKPDNLISDFVISNPKEKISEEGMKTARLIPEKSALVCCIGSVGKVSINTECCTTNQQINSIVFDQPDLLDNEFGLYVTLAAKEEYIKHSNKVVVSILNKTDQGSIKVPKPPLSKQKIIAKFLKHKTLSIDALISDKEKLIKLLEEKRQATITEAVTKGLDPNVKMKGSGVEWIGEIPNHWDTIKLKRLATRIEVGIAEAATHAYRNQGVPIIRSKNIKNGKIINEGVFYIDRNFAEKNKSKYIWSGDLVTVRTGNAGVTGVVPQELDMCQCFTMLITTLKNNNNPYFYSYYLNSTVGESFFEISAWGTAQKNISVPILEDCLVPHLELEEQNRITEYLDQKTEEIDSSIKMIKSQTNKLKEYRQALIYEAVTGKIDVQEMLKETEQEEVSSS